MPKLPEKEALTAGKGPSDSEGEEADDASGRGAKKGRAAHRAAVKMASGTTGKRGRVQGGKVLREMLVPLKKLAHAFFAGVPRAISLC